ncbi:hypothetical protein GNZ11_31760 [Paraburkholderia xenovorans]|nr:hypothetical protein [Paraburkholderia xenovorans]
MRAAAHAGTITAMEIVDWAHEQMASYKTPRVVEFVESLPKSGSGKIWWRQLQERTGRARPVREVRLLDDVIPARGAENTLLIVCL